MKKQAIALFDKVKQHYKHQQYAQFFQLIDGALLLAEQHGETDIFIDFTLDKVAAYFQFGDFEIAIQALQEVSKVIEDECSEAYIRYVNAKAALYGALEDHETCYTYLCEAKQLAERERSMANLMIIEANISHYFYEQGRYEEALTSIRAALTICEDIGYEQRQLFLLGRARYIQICVQLGDSEEAAKQIAYVKQVANYEQLPHYKVFVKALVTYMCAAGQYEQAYSHLREIMATYDEEDVAYSYFYELFIEVAEQVEPVTQYVVTLRTYYEFLQQQEQQQEQQRVKRLNMYFKMDHLEQLSWIDPLTQIKNRRYLEAYAEQWLEESTGGVAAILFDADNFKAINDTHGHSVGDEVICLMAKCAETFFNKQDALFVRYGGDEFLVLCRMRCETKLYTLLDSFQYMMHAQTYLNNEPLYISIGATFCQQPPYVLDELIAQADMALYDVKQDGRQHFTIHRRQ